jgi:DNA-binding NarL/FixJ family response regulator
MSDRIRILLAEDQELVRRGLHYILAAQPDMQVVGEAADGNEAVRLALVSEPQIILMDIRLPGRTGIEATRAILESRPGTRIILLTTFDIQEYVYEGIRAGAVGYLLKDTETQTLLESIRAADRGAVIYRSASSGQAMSQAVGVEREFTPNPDFPSPLVEPLTAREQEILQQMAYGRRNSEIAELLSISEGTVKTHIHRILQKFQVEDRTQAVVIALRTGIVG